MECLNKIELRGIVGRSSTTPCGGVKACNFSLLTEYAYKGNDGCATIDTMWWNVMAYGLKPGWPDMEKIQKGSKIHVIGRVRAKRYSDGQGIERTVYEVVAQEIQFVED